MEQYIGQEKIQDVLDLENQKTPGGESIVEVTFEGGKKEVMPKRRLELLVVSAEEGYETIEIRNKINAQIGAMIFGLMHEYGIKVGEVDSLVDHTVNLVNNAHSKAKEILIGFEQLETPLNIINKILIEDAKSKKDSDGAIY